jgi:hypothetical protein
MEMMKSIPGARHIGDLLRDKNIALKGADVLSQRGLHSFPITSYDPKRYRRAQSSFTQCS